MHSLPTPVSGRALAALVLSLAVLAGLAGPTDADVDPSWDHYKAYVLQQPIPYDTQVTLHDQFGVTSHVTQSLDRFANPVEKRHGTVISPIHRPDLHYAWWKITPEVPVGRDLVVINQFGEQGITVDRSVYLLNPALKNEASDVPLPLANHYKCYTCSGPPVSADVFLTDQFFARPALVLDPRFFCTPVEKHVAGGAVYPIVDREQTYVVYEIAGTPLIWTASIRDQFLSSAFVTLFNDHLLMVPTDKLTPTPEGPSTWGRVKSQYR
jgi:hypothetical protein